MASRNSPIPSRVSTGRFKGELTGSRHSSRGSRRAESHSNVEEVILKHSLKESGFLGMAESAAPTRRPSLEGLVSSEGASDSGDRDRFRLLERRERVVAVCEVERKGMRRELKGKERESAEGGEMTKRRRRSSDTREESRAARALLSIFSQEIGGFEGDQ